MKLFIRLISVIGFLIFSSLFSATFISKNFAEKISATFIDEHIHNKVFHGIDEFFQSPKSSKIGVYAENLLASQEKRLEAVKLKLKNQVAKKISQSIAEMRNLDCECRQKYEKYIESSFVLEKLSLKESIKKVESFTKSKYMQLVHDLKKEIRIFSIINASVFLLLFIASFVKPKAFKHLVLPAILLLIATIICVYCYVFQQNWFLTIIYSDYLGFWYAGYLSIVFFLLVDILLNRARVTSKIINSFLNAIGSSLHVLPC